MSAAGREIGLSPAVVSKRISQLEERLGARLFQRTTRQLMLTETGAGYFKRVVDILSLCNEAEDFVSRRNTKPRGLLKVTMPTAFGRLHIAPYVDSFLARYPEIELHVSSSDVIVDIIREGFDLAIRIGELEDSSLVARRLAPDTRVLCAAPAYIAKHGLPAKLVNLEAHNCLVADAIETWKLSGPEGDVQVRPYGTVRSDSGEVIRELVMSGVGIGLLSTWDIGPALRSGALRLVLPQYRGAVAGAVHAVYPSREYMPAKVDVLIEFLADLYGAVPYWEREIDIDKLGARSAAGRASRRSPKLPAQAVASR
jgi:DNA-binding transcriptional LysR family regulator